MLCFLPNFELHEIDMSGFFKVFRVNGRLSWWLVALYAAINLLVLVNALLHSPYVGYDIPEHLKNVTAISQFHLPIKGESREYYSPPLPYVIPAIAMLAGANTWWAGKVGQVVNIFLSLATTWYLLRLCEQIFPGDSRFKLFSLGLLGMMPVYYKTFAQMRGEPYLAFLVIFIFFLSAQVFIAKDDRPRNLFMLGLALGLAVLARQWGFFLFPGLICTVLLLTRADVLRWKTNLRSLAVIFGLAFLVGSWFYLFLYSQYGTFAAYGLQPQAGNQFANKLDSLTGTDNGKLFIDPVRPSLGNHFFPVMYSDFWGDYHAYFLISIKNKKTDEFMSGVQLEKWMNKTKGELPGWIITNRYTFNSYLGRVNIVSIPPTLLLLCGFFYTFYAIYQFLREPGNPQSAQLGLLGFTTLFTVGGYMLFVLRYPISGDGDILKATYLMQAFPLIALQTAALLQKVRYKWLIYLLAAGLSVVALHNIPAMLTHYIDIPKF